MFEVFSFARLARDWYNIQKENELGRLRELSGVVCSFGFNIYHVWMEDLKGKLPRILYQGPFVPQPLATLQTKQFQSPSFQFNTDGILGLLEQIYITLRGYFIGESAIPGVVNDLLKFAGATAFIDLLKASCLPRVVLTEVYQCTGRIEEWCKSHGMSGSIIQFEHLMVHMCFFCL